MEFFTQIIKDYFIPGSAICLIIGLAVGVVLFYLGERPRKWGRIWLTLLAIFYWIISTPLGAKVLESGLSHGYDPLDVSEEIESVEAIVILGGGSIDLKSRGEVISLLVSESALRAMEGIRLYDMMEDPMVIVSGGENPFLEGGVPESELISDLLIDAGLPEERIILESKSQSTREQARILKPILDAYEIDQFLLVTSPIHMRRSLAVFTSEGVHPIPGPSSLISEVFSSGDIGIFPSWIALDASQAAFREYMALTYYWVRGWL
jgi:uncharacterized SAM-binding protein YcdF (DUF218 family)